MSNNTVTRTEFNALKSDVSKILVLLEGGAPAKATPKPARKAPAKKAAPKATTLTRKTRPAFVKANPWAKGLSTQCIASMLVEDPSMTTDAWVVGPRYTEMFSA